MNDSIGIIGGAEDIFAGAMGMGVGVLIAFVFVLLFFAFVTSVVSYILCSIGLYTIAERRKLQHAWLAWVPIAGLWLLGSISDQYQYVVKGQITNRRKTLLILNIIAVVTRICAQGASMGTLGVGVLFGFVSLLVLIALYVYEYIAYYDLFRSCQPSNGVLYLVLSILIPVTLPFFVFFIRKKDLGMPPRKQPTVAPVAEGIVEEAPAEEAIEEIVEEITEEPIKEIVEEPTEETVEETTEE